MQDSRIKQLARNLVNYSCRVQPGENVLIELNGEAPELACALIEEVYRAGGRPFVNLLQEDVKEALLQNADQSLLEQTAKYEAARMQDMQAYIGVRAGANSFAGRKGGALQQILAKTCAYGYSRASHQVGYSALAQRQHGPAGPNAHASI